MLKYFDIKPVLSLVKKPQANAPVERVHQVIVNMIVTKDLDNKVFDYIDPWGETIASIAWLMRASYNCTILSTPGQSVFGVDMVFNLASFVYWGVSTAAKQHQLDIPNIRENAKRFMHDYIIGNRFYVEIIVICRKLDYKKQGPYRITEVSTNSKSLFK